MTDAQPEQPTVEPHELSTMQPFETDPDAGQPTGVPTAPPQDREPDPLRGSRTSGLWFGVGALCVLLILLIVFIAQNTQDVEVSFLAWDGRAPLAVSLLIAAACGIGLTGIAGTMRIFQLRRRVRRTRRRGR